MAARSIGSGVISFGLVTIPFKVYTAVSEKKISFNLLHKCGSRVKQQLVCPVDNVVIERADTVRGYEHARDHYVTFTDAELKEIEESRPGDLTLEAFVPASTVDLLYIERTYYLGPDKGGDRSYRVLAIALEQEEKIAVGRYIRQGKELLVLLRAVRVADPKRGLVHGIIMHEAYYADEVKPFSAVDLPDAEVSPEMLQLAGLLIGQLERPVFDPSQFEDTYAKKVLSAVNQKVAGEPVVAAPAPKAVVIDLLEALKRSVASKGAELDKLRRERPMKGPKKAVPRKGAPKKKRGSGE